MKKNHQIIRFLIDKSRFVGHSFPSWFTVNFTNMKIRIGAVEIEVNSMEELDPIIQRYAGAIPAAGEAPNAPSSSGQGTASASHAGKVSDGVVLKRLVEVGMNGMPTKELGQILGRGGKATMRAAHEWAVRIGLVQDVTQQAIERCRIGSQRGARIIPALQEVARALLNHK